MGPANLRTPHAGFFDRTSPLFRISYQRRHKSTSAPAERTPQLTHIDSSGRPSMVDVSSKEPTRRTATAAGRIYIPRVAYELITEPPAHEEAAAAAAGDSRAAVSALDKAKRKARSKGDVLTVAQLAAIMGCKRTSDLVPLCHPLQLSHIAVALHPEVHQRASEESAKFAQDTSSEHGSGSNPSRALAGVAPRSAFSVRCVATVTCEGKTGVEMEALTAVSVGLLTVWDMLKAVAGREMVMGDIAVVEKQGGKSGDFTRDSNV